MNNHGSENACFQLSDTWIKKIFEVVFIDLTEATNIRKFPLGLYFWTIKLSISSPLSYWWYFPYMGISWTEAKWFSVTLKLLKFSARPTFKLTLIKLKLICFQEKMPS